MPPAQCKTGAIALATRWSALFSRSSDHEEVCMAEANGTVRVAAVSDVHYGKASQGMLVPLFTEIARQADVLVISGDLTDYGLPEEARALAKDLTTCVKIPVVVVLGNHDYESGK